MAAPGTGRCCGSCTIPLTVAKIVAKADPVITKRETAAICTNNKSKRTRRSATRVHGRMSTPFTARRTVEKTRRCARENGNRATKSRLRAEARYARGGGPSGGETRLGAEGDASLRVRENRDRTAVLGADVNTVGWPSSVAMAAVLGSGELLRQRHFWFDAA